MERHFRAYPRTHRELLPVGGVLQWRRDGELHVWNPDTVAKLQHAVQQANGNQLADYSEFSRMVNEEAVRKGLLRGLLRLRPVGPAVPVAEVEPAAEIVKRFTTGAMSLGSLSREAHETLAIAMNRMERTLQHRRGRRGSLALRARRQRGPATLGHQAGGLRTLRRDRPLPGQRRSDPDQDGPGRQARRGRSAARAQGGRLHRPDSQLHPGREPRSRLRPTTTSTRSRTSSS